ncbi:hypothetical protein DUNSADRAFT_3020 [Dunaliella salina]|uniref:DRBM domain-containing protein n=1 Tax=Dunaliella salina TaxID=3046 RepID=A0ABQ7GUQ3_DUNSA|nr:hypothetical protein DUNSADRAFT_3020 [Dunaliella salina]|eukprot:KAF5838349.1 hypothetical protein DUNSADRAFT_3020 [Dunaliella salina]
MGTMKEPQPGQSGGRQQQGKRPATGPAGVDFEDEEEEQQRQQQQQQQQRPPNAAKVGGRGAGGRKARGKKAAAAAAAASAAGQAGKGEPGVEGKAAEGAGAQQQQQQPQQQQQQQQQQRQQQQQQQAPGSQKAGSNTGAAAAATPPSSAASGLASAALTHQPEAGGKGKKGAAAAARAAQAAASQQPAYAAAAAAPSAANAGTSTPGAAAGAGAAGAGGAAGGGPAGAQAGQLPDMANYLDTYPACKRVMTGIRAMPNNSTKTPVSLINEYASRMMLEVVFSEEADTPTGPYTVTCALHEKTGKKLDDVGKGRGRNKRDARQVAAAACVEAMLQHKVPEVDFYAPAKPVVKNPNIKPGLGYSGRAGGYGSMGLKKRRDGDSAWSGSFMGGPMGVPRAGGYGSPAGPGASGGWQPPPQRPVPFTRATLPSSLPSSFNRLAAEVVPPRPHPPPPQQPPPPYSLRAFQPPPPQEQASHEHLQALAAALGTRGPVGPPGPGQAGAFGMHTLQVRIIHLHAEQVLVCLACIHCRYVCTNTC